MFSLAYRMLGEDAEAEDVVQDAYLRWQRSEGVVEPVAWLTKVVFNLYLNRLTSARARREAHVGPWLPEPVLSADGALGPLDTVEQRESLSFGMLVLLQRLIPPERAVFVLREAFGHTHREIGAMCEFEEPHVRQLYPRVRRHVGEPRRRFTADTAVRARHPAQPSTAVCRTRASAWDFTDPAGVRRHTVPRCHEFPACLVQQKSEGRDHA